MRLSTPCFIGLISNGCALIVEYWAWFAGRVPCLLPDIFAAMWALPRVVETLLACSYDWTWFGDICKSCPIEF